MLIIDDEAGIRMLLGRVFGSSHHVSIAASVDEGLRQLTLAEPDIILMDVDMPGKTGIQGLHEIRLINPYVRIIIMTGSLLTVDKDEILALGADAFVAKPFVATELKSIVAQLANSGRPEARDEMVLHPAGQPLAHFGEN